MNQPPLQRRIVRQTLPNLMLFAAPNCRIPRDFFLFTSSRLRVATESGYAWLRVAKPRVATSLTNTSNLSLNFDA